MVQGGGNRFALAVCLAQEESRAMAAKKHQPSQGQGLNLFGSAAALMAARVAADPFVPADVRNRYRA